MSNGAVHPTEWFHQAQRTYRELQTREELFLPWWAYAAFYPVKVGLRAIEEFRRNQGVNRAAALAFTTLLAMVPLSVVVFRLIALTPQFEQFRQSAEDRLFSYLLPTKSGEVQQFLQEIGNRTGNLGELGLIMLVVTSIMLLNSVERTFNAVWGVKRQRSWVRRLVSYWNVLTLPVILIGIGQYVFARFTFGIDNSFATSVLVLIPTWLGFTFLNMFVPNTRVSVRAALIAGVVGGSMWEAGKYGFLNFSAGLIQRYESLYGSLATIPLTLIWIYMSWLIVIVGAEIAFAVQYPESPRISRERAARQRTFREYYAVRLMTAIVQRFSNKAVEPVHSEELAGELETVPEVLLPLLDRLSGAGLILLTEEGGWVPALPPDAITIDDVIAALNEGRFSVPDQADDDTSTALRSHFDQVRGALSERLTAVTIADLARRPGV